MPIPASDNPEFYSTAAEVIPLLMVVLLIELRLLGRPRGMTDKRRKTLPLGDAIFGTVLVALFVLGELAALDAVNSGNPSGWDKFIVPAALQLGLILLLLGLGYPFYASIFDRIGPMRRLRDRLRGRGERGPGPAR